MNTLLRAVKYDFLQRIRSYSFLLVLCATLLITYHFVPAPGASYSTVRFGTITGTYNLVWISYVSAIMTAVFLSLAGSYLVNAGIKKDMDTQIGPIIASTASSNFKYLLLKSSSNFLVLLSILVPVVVMTFCRFYLQPGQESFSLTTFILPFGIICIPALFITAVLAVVFEVVFRKQYTLKNIVYFFFFTFLLMGSNFQKNSNFDLIGTRYLTNHLASQIEAAYPDSATQLSIGFVINDTAAQQAFTFTETSWHGYFIGSRILWMLGSLLLLVICALFFHRFSVKPTSVRTEPRPETNKHLLGKMDLSALAIGSVDYTILPLIKTEYLLLLRSAHKWHYVIMFSGFFTSMLAPLYISTQYILPLLWFLQVRKLGSLGSKEFQYNTHLLSFSTYKPLHRLAVAQGIACVLFLLSLAIPVLIRLSIIGQFASVLGIGIGSILISTLAFSLGTLTKNNKLFELLFFGLTYAFLNRVPFADFLNLYTAPYTLTNTWIAMSILFLIISIVVRRKQVYKN